MFFLLILIPIALIVFLIVYHDKNKLNEIQTGTHKPKMMVQNDVRNDALGTTFAAFLFVFAIIGGAASVILFCVALSDGDEAWLYFFISLASAISLTFFGWLVKTFSEINVSLKQINSKLPDDKVFIVKQISEDTGENE